VMPPRTIQSLLKKIAKTGSRSSGSARELHGRGFREANLQDGEESSDRRPPDTGSSGRERRAGAH
jgi:hypothetical protein